MEDEKFWENVRHGCAIIGVSDDLFYVWKHRGRVSRDKLVPLYVALQGTEHAIPLERLHNNI